MTDIVERLREGFGADKLLVEAADEIERLRNVIARLDIEIAELHEELLSK